MTEHRDILDLASDLSEKERDNNTRLIQDKVKPKQVKVDGKWPITECVECDAEIGEARLEATGSNICIICAAKKDQQERMYAKR